MNLMTEMFIFILFGFLHLTISAPTQDASGALREKGCHYLSQHYSNGETIDTNEPCLNCTCLNNMLMCYLRICPFMKPIGKECIIERNKEDCCPKIWCPEVVEEEKKCGDSDSSQDERQGGCYLNGRYFSEGSRLPVDPLNPCEICYCIRNSSTCVVQQCELHVEGCSPIFTEGQCCPCRYNCTYEESTTAPPGVTLAELAGGCLLEDGTMVEDGAAINGTTNPCEHCYCMRNELVCAIEECQVPGPKCQPLEPRPGQCCPDRYKCPTVNATSTNVSDATKDSSTDVSTVFSITEVKTNEEKILTTLNLKTTEFVEIKDTHTTILEEEKPSSPVDFSLSSMEKHGDETPHTAEVNFSDLNESTQSSLGLQNSVATARMPSNRYGVKVAQSKKTYDQSVDEERSELAPTPSFPLFPSHSRDRPIQKDHVKGDAHRSSEFVGKVPSIDQSAKKTVPSKGTPGKTETKYSLRWPPAGHVPGEQLGPARNFTSSQFSKKRPAVLPIPGEGVCRIGGVVYQNGQPFSSKDPCKTDCHCINSVILCTDVICEQKPETSDNCQEIIDPKKCCPEYVCGIETTEETSKTKPAEHPASYSEYTTSSFQIRTTERTTEFNNLKDESSVPDDKLDETFSSDSSHHMLTETMMIKTTSKPLIETVSSTVFKEASLADKTTAPEKTISTDNIPFTTVASKKTTSYEESTNSENPMHTSKASDEQITSDKEIFTIPYQTTQNYDEISTEESEVVQTISSTTIYNFETTTFPKVPDTIDLKLKDHLFSNEKKTTSTPSAHSSEAADHDVISEKESFTFPSSSTEQFDKISTEKSEDETDSVHITSSTTTYIDTKTFPKLSGASDLEVKDFSPSNEETSKSKPSMHTSEASDEKVVSGEEHLTTQNYVALSTEKSERDTSIAHTISSTIIDNFETTVTRVSDGIDLELKDTPSSDEESTKSEPSMHTGEASDEIIISEKERITSPSSTTKNYDELPTQKTEKETTTVQRISSTTINNFDTTTISKSSYANDFELKDSTSFNEESSNSESSLHTSEASEEEIVTKKELLIDPHDNIVVTFTSTLRDDTTSPQSTSEKAKPDDEKSIMDIHTTTTTQDMDVEHLETVSTARNSFTSEQEKTFSIVKETTQVEHFSTGTSVQTLSTNKEIQDVDYHETTSFNVFSDDFLKDFNETSTDMLDHPEKEQVNNNVKPFTDTSLPSTITSEIDMKYVTFPHSTKPTSVTTQFENTATSLDGEELEHKVVTGEPQNLILSSSEMVQDLDKEENILYSTAKAITNATSDEPALLLSTIKFSMNDSHPTVTTTHKGEEKIEFTTQFKTQKITFLPNDETEITSKAPTKNVEYEPSTHFFDVEKVVTSESTVSHAKMTSVTQQSVTETSKIVSDDFSTPSKHLFDKHKVISSETTAVEELISPTVLPVESTPLLIPVENDELKIAISEEHPHKVIDSSDHDELLILSSDEKLFKPEVDKILVLNEDNYFTEVDKLITVSADEKLTSEPAHSFSEKSTETHNIAHLVTSEMIVPQTSVTKEIGESEDNYYTDVHQTSSVVAHEDISSISPHKLSQESTETQGVVHSTTLGISIQTAVIPEKINLLEDKHYNEIDEIASVNAHEDVTSKSYPTQDVTQLTTSVVNIQDTSVTVGSNLSEKKQHTETDEISTSQEDVASESFHSFSEKSTEIHEVTHPTTLVMNIQSTSIPKETSPTEDKHYTEVGEISTITTHKDVTLASSHSFTDKSTETQEVTQPTTSVSTIQDTLVEENINLSKDKYYTIADEIPTDISHEDITSESFPNFSDKSTVTQDVTYAPTSVINIQDSSIKEGFNLSEDKHYTEVQEITAVTSQEDFTSESSHSFSEKSTETHELTHSKTSEMNIPSTSIIEGSSLLEDKHHTEVDETTAVSDHKDIALASSDTFSEKSTQKHEAVQPTSTGNIKDTFFTEDADLSDKNYTEIEKITTTIAVKDVTSESSLSFSKDSTEEQDVTHTTTSDNNIQGIAIPEETNLSVDKHHFEVDSITTVLALEDVTQEPSHSFSEKPLVGSITGTHSEIVLNVGPSAFTKLDLGNASNASDIYVIHINKTISEMIEIKTPAALQEENDEKYGLENNENLFAITISPFQSNEERVVTSTEFTPFELKSTLGQKLTSLEIIDNTQFIDDENVDSDKLGDFSTEKEAATGFDQTPTQKAGSEVVSLKDSVTENTESTKIHFTVTSMSESTSVPTIQDHNDGNSSNVENDLSTPIKQTSSQGFETPTELTLIKLPEGDIFPAKGSIVQPENLLMNNTNWLEVLPHENTFAETSPSSTPSSEILKHESFSSLSGDNKDISKEEQPITTTTSLIYSSTYSSTEENSHLPSQTEESNEENTSPEGAHDSKDIETTAPDLFVSSSVSSFITDSDKIQLLFSLSTADEINKKSAVTLDTDGLKESSTGSYGNIIETSSLQFQHISTEDGSLDYESNYSSNAAEMKLNSSSLIIEQFTITDSDESNQPSFTMLTEKTNSSLLENTPQGVYNLHSFTETVGETDRSTEKEPLLSSSTELQATSEETQKEQDNVKKTEYPESLVSSTIYFTESYTDKFNTMVEVKISAENQKKETLQTTEQYLPKAPSLVTNQHLIEEVSSTMKTSTDGAVVPKKFTTEVGPTMKTSTAGATVPEKFTTEGDPILKTSTDSAVVSEKLTTEVSSTMKTSTDGAAVSEKFTTEVSSTMKTSTDGAAASEKFTTEGDPTLKTSTDSAVVSGKLTTEVSSTMKTSTDGAAVSEKFTTELSLTEIAQQSLSFSSTENEEIEEGLQTDAALTTNKVFTVPVKEESHYENENVKVSWSGISDDIEKTNDLTENIKAETITEYPHSTSTKQHSTSDYSISTTAPNITPNMTEKYADFTEDNSNEIFEIELEGVLIDQKNVPSISVHEIEDLSDESTNIIAKINGQEKENVNAAANKNDSHITFEEPEITSFENTETMMDVSGESQVSSVGTNTDDESTNIITKSNGQEQDNASPTTSKTDSHKIFEEPKVENSHQEKIILPTTQGTTEEYLKNSNITQLDDSSSKLFAMLTTHPFLSTLIETQTTLRLSNPTTTSVDVHTTSELPPAKLGTQPDTPEMPDEGLCLYNGDVYHSAEEVPRADPCEFCFCFRGEIICLQQTCPPPIHGCFATPIRGFCCPRFHCPVQEKYFNSSSPFEAAPRSRLSYMLQKTPSATGCEIEGVIYRIHQLVRPSSGPCMQCRCEGGGMMRCDPRDCQPQPPLVLRLNRDFFERK